MNVNHLTIEGNLTADPELRFTASGVAVTTFTLAHTPRKFNKTTEQWEDGDTTFLRCTTWRQHGENVAESLGRGTRVIVTGKLVVRQYEAKDGSRGTSVEIDVDCVGPVLQNATARVTKVERGAASNSAPVVDEWATTTDKAPF
jgi:single-strand DNA-binding protein